MAVINGSFRKYFPIHQHLNLKKLDRLKESDQEDLGFQQNKVLGVGNTDLINYWDTY